MGSLSTLNVKKSGMGLQNPVTSAAEKYTSLLRESWDIIGAVTGDKGFPTDDHIWAVKEDRREGKKYQYDANDTKLQ